MGVQLRRVRVDWTQQLRPLWTTTVPVQVQQPPRRRRRLRSWSTERRRRWGDTLAWAASSIPPRYDPPPPPPNCHWFLLYYFFEFFVSKLLIASAKNQGGTSVSKTLGKSRIVPKKPNARTIFSVFSCVAEIPCSNSRRRTSRCVSVGNLSSKFGWNLWWICQNCCALPIL